MKLYLTVEKARVEPFTTKSSFSRVAANEIGIAASEGLISTRIEDGVYCNKWMITAEGMIWLMEVQDELASD